MSDYNEMTIEQLEQVRSEAQADKRAAQKIFVEAGKVLDKKRRQAKLGKKKAALKAQQKAIEQELAEIE